jgi:hypothetical protein
VPLRRIRSTARGGVFILRTLLDIGCMCVHWVLKD